MRFAVCDQASIESNQGLIPTEGGWQRGGEQGLSQAASTAGDVTLTLAQSTVVVERSKPSQGRSFLTTDLSQFGHADDECQRGALTNARDAQHQVKPAGKIVVATKKLGNGTYLSLPSCLQPSDVAADKASQPRFIDMLEPGLEAREVLLDLLEKGRYPARSANLGSGAILGGPIAAAHAAIKIASSASFLAWRKCTRPKALTCIGCSTRTMKPAARKCSTTPRS